MWIETMHPRLARLEDFELPDDFPFDYSRASLDWLEVIIQERFHDSQAVTADNPQGFVDAAMGYIGEALLRVGGGSWVWDDDPASASYGLPLARPDGEIDLPPVSPLHLVIESVRRRTGSEFARVHAALEEVVTDRKAQNSSWSPTKEPTPGVDILTPVTSEFLISWLAERETAFPQWMAEYADNGTGPWDFSAKSLDALEVLTRRVLKSEEALSKPENSDFIEGAAWYLGEVMRRVKGAEWRYNFADPNFKNPWAGNPYVRLPIESGHGTVPRLVLEIAAVENQQAGFLRAELGRFTN